MLPNSASTPTRHRICAAILILIGVTPAIGMLNVVVTHWLPLPYWDEWFTPGKQFTEWCQGTLSFGDLFVQHNESRKFFPRLFYFAMMKLHGWDVRDAMVLTFASVCAISALLYRLLRRTPGATAAAALLAWVVTSFLCFSPVQLRNFLWGLQFEPFVPCLVLLAAANINLSNLAMRIKVLALIVLCVVATYTFANGMILWLLAFPILPVTNKWSGKYPWGWWGVYVLAACVAIGAYFIGYARPSDHPAVALELRHVVHLAHYFVLWVGAYFHSPTVSALFAGSVAVAVLLALATIGGYITWRTREWRWLYPAMLLAAYAIITGLTTAAGRIGLGVSQALEVRYTVFSLAFYLALVCGSLALYGRYVQAQQAQPRRAVLGTSVLLLVLAAPAWLGCYRVAEASLSPFYERHRRLLRALEWIDVIPDNGDLALVFPYVPVLKHRAGVVRAHGVLRLPFVGEPLATIVKQTPQAQDYRYGSVASASVQYEHDLVIRGWAWLPDKNKKPDCIVVGAKRANGTFELLGVAEALKSRPDLQKLFSNAEMGSAGFDTTIKLNPKRQRGVAEIGLWAVDLDRATAYPVKGGRELKPVFL